MSAGAPPETLHATCVAWSGRGALITGASGSGKSALALRLLALGAVLVADDRVQIRRNGRTLLASAPPPLSGLIEARGIGLFRLVSGPATVQLCIDLDGCEEKRLPHLRTRIITGLCVPLIFGQNQPDLPQIVMAALRHGQRPLLLDPEDPSNADRA